MPVSRASSSRECSGTQGGPVLLSALPRAVIPSRLCASIQYAVRLGLVPARLQADDLMTGAVLECFVASELTKQIGWSLARPRLFHYRTHTQQEVDFLMENGRGRLVGIEVKKTASPKSSDFKGLRHLG